MWKFRYISGHIPKGYGIGCTLIIGSLFGYHIYNKDEIEQNPPIRNAIRHEDNHEDNHEDTHENSATPCSAQYTTWLGCIKNDYDNVLCAKESNDLVKCLESQT